MKISIIGSGVVGKATGMGFNDFGNKVVFHDVNKQTLNTLKSDGYKVSFSMKNVVLNSQISFICVPTPTVSGKQDLVYINKVAVDLAQCLIEKKAYHLIVVRSTVLPGTIRNNVVPILEKHSKLKVGQNFGICSNPEFAREESTLEDFLNSSRIIIGEFDKRSGDLLTQLYTPFKRPIIRTTIETAEMIKYVANCFLSTKISYFNEIYTICKKLGLDSHFIAKAVALDPRIGNYGIIGGRPFAGACLPKDLGALIELATDNKITPHLLNSVNYVNENTFKEKLN